MLPSLNFRTHTHTHTILSMFQEEAASFGTEVIHRQVELCRRSEYTWASVDTAVGGRGWGSSSEFSWNMQSLSKVVLAAHSRS